MGLQDKEATESANVTGPLTSSEENDKHQSMWNSLFRALVKEAEKASNSGPSRLLIKATTPSTNVNSNTDAAIVRDMTKQQEEQTWLRPSRGLWQRQEHWHR